MAVEDTKPIIVIGAGLVGLTLAQGLKKAGFDFRIYDRDNSIDERPAGWGITMDWAMPSLQACLPPEVFAQIPSIQVNPKSGHKADDRYRFLNLETGEEKSSVPASTLYRLNRKRFRHLLATDIEVNWGRRCTGFDTTDDGVVVHFADGTRIEGSLLLAVDGKNSTVKRQLIGEESARLNPLPVGFIGLTLKMPREQMQPFLDIHPVIWQGCHPGTGYFVFFSALSTPETNGSAGGGGEYYEGQFNMSWMVDRHGETPRTAPEQIAKAKGAAVAGTGMFPTLRQAILGIPDDSPALGIKLEDWPTQRWPSRGGRVTLLGDAAHTMTMCECGALMLPSNLCRCPDANSGVPRLSDRGEAANHGIYDAVELVRQLQQWRGGAKSREEALRDYQLEVAERTYEAVLLSRYACLESHDLDNMSEESNVLNVRIHSAEKSVRGHI